MGNIKCRRSQWSRSLRRGSAEIMGSNPTGGNGCLSLGKNTKVFIEYEVVWVAGPAWMFRSKEKSLVPFRIRISDRSARSLVAIATAMSSMMPFLIFNTFSFSL